MPLIAEIPQTLLEDIEPSEVQPEERRAGSEGGTEYFFFLNCRAAFPIARPMLVCPGQAQS